MSRAARGQQAVPDGANEGRIRSLGAGRFNVSSWERLQQGEREKDAVMKTFHHRLGPLTCFARLKQLAGCAGAGSQQQGPAPVTATCPSADTRAG